MLDGWFSVCFTKPQLLESWCFRRICAPFLISKFLSHMLAQKSEKMLNKSTVKTQKQKREMKAHFKKSPRFLSQCHDFFPGQLMFLNI